MICKKCGNVMGFTLSGHFCSCGHVSVEGIRVPVYSEKGDVQDIILRDGLKNE